jgi:formylglycine-generating enzyme required for sulfatase activity
VGLYPRAASPDGLLDAAGNIWEWCLNRYAEPDEVDTTGEGDRSLRGGSWGSSPAGAVGFRLVCACPIDSEH